MTSRHTPLVPGPQEAAADWPDLSAGGARRTTTIDTERPDGFTEPARITLRGRDVLSVGPADRPTLEPVGEATLTAVVRQGVLEEIGGDVPDGVAAALEGASLRSGFGARVADALGDGLARRTLTASLLEDLAGAYFVSGTVLLWAGLNDIDTEGLGIVVDMQADVCAGWRRGDQQHQHLVEHAAIAQPDGPPAPPLEQLGGVDGWHAHMELSAHSHRRARVLDVSPTPGGHLVRAHFRDSVRDDSPERALHEYSVSADVDTGGRVASVGVVAHVLPWAECPGAVASAQSVVGTPVRELATTVRRELRGESTCTHLNATLRSLADTGALLDLVG